MPSNRALSDVLQIDDKVRIEQTVGGAVLDTPSGNRLCVTGTELNALLAFKTPKTVLRVLTMAGSDEERSKLSDKLSDWIDLGVLRISRTTYDATPVVAMTSAECRNIFFIFAGAQGGMMMNPLEFLQTAGLSNQNIVLLRDGSQTWFLNGVGDGINSFRELLAWQSGFLEGAAHADNHYCIGSSMGAFSALVFGHLLKARAVWGFGLARTTVPIRNTHGEPWDLERLLCEWNGVSRYYLYFNQSWEPDREAAMKLAQLPGVELCPQDGDGHVVLEHLAEIGKLPSIFPRNLSARSATGPVIRGTTDCESEVLKVLRSILPRYSDDLDATTSLAGILDSFALVSLLGKLATDLGVDLDPDRLTDADFENASSIAQAIVRESTPAK
jgi:acyl carrier protein